MRVVVAPSEFKGTLSAPEAARAIAEGVEEAIPRADIVTCPIADGGGGTAGVLLEALDGEYVSVPASTPRGRPGWGGFVWLPPDMAFVELATASGLVVAEKEGVVPLKASTRGTGDVVASAVERNPRRVIVGMGGSATSDAGSGIAEALGVGLLGPSGAAIGPGAEGLMELRTIDLSHRLPSLAGVSLEAACDVTNPLLGELGAARVFASQKGAGSREIEIIEQALAHFADVVHQELGISLHDMPMAGAAGGASAGMHALLGAELRGGFDMVSELVGFPGLMKGADLLIVGEGSLDDQSLKGKAPIAAARLAHKAGVRVWAFAGVVKLSRTRLQQEGIETAIELTKVGGSAMADPAEVLRHTISKGLSREFPKR